MLDQYLGPGFIVAALGLVFTAFRLNRSDAKEAVETAGMNTDQAMKRAEAAEMREKDLRERLAAAEAENARLLRIIRDAGVES